MLGIYDMICGWIIRFALFAPLVIWVVQSYAWGRSITRTEQVVEDDGTVIFRRRGLTLKEIAKDTLHSTTLCGKIIIPINIALIVFSWVILFI